MREMAQDRIALDRAAVSARTLDPYSGHLHVAQTNISKATVNPYNGSEIPGADELGLDPNRVYQLLRHPDELEKAAKSFNGKPLVMIHRAQATDDKDHENRVGSVGNVVYDHPYLKADLAVWAKEAIDAIEDGTQRELSCGYAYRPVMTPGTFEGQRYDGIMTAIGGNHVALVKEGRAGADCHVFDSIEGLKMTKITLKPKGAAVLGALTAYLKPKLAQDAKIDLRPMLKGVDQKTWKTDKPRLAVDLKRQVAGKLAKDANVEDVMELLDALEEIVPEMEVEKLDTVSNVEAPPAAEDADDAALRDFLKGLGLSDEDIDKACAMANAPVATDESSAVVSAGEEDDNGGAGRTMNNSGSGVSKEDLNALEGARDKIPGKDKGMVTKSAMDAAMALTRREAHAEATKTFREIRDAERLVRPWVGELVIAQDSAESVMRAALETLGYDRARSVHKDALADILNTYPKPGERPVRTAAAAQAMDAAQVDAFDKMFPNNNRLAN